MLLAQGINFIGLAGTWQFNLSNARQKDGLGLSRGS